jgi:hypothetical protein
MVLSLSVGHTSLLPLKYNTKGPCFIGRLLNGKIQTPACGILAATSLQTLIEVAVQAHPVKIRMPNPEFLKLLYGNRPVPGASNAEGFDFYEYLKPNIYSTLIRAAAAEGILKLFAVAVADHVTMLRLPTELRRTWSSSSGGTDGGYTPTMSDMICVAFHIITTDPDAAVRRSVALSLLRTLQEVGPFRMSLSAISLGDVMECVDCWDCSAFTILPDGFKSFLWNGWEHQQDENKIKVDSLPDDTELDCALLMANDASTEMETCVRYLWTLLTDNPIVTFDQVVNSKNIFHLTNASNFLFMTLIYATF